MAVTFGQYDTQKLKDARSKEINILFILETCCIAILTISAIAKGILGESFPFLLLLAFLVISIEGDK